jgi:hypothetical protein
LLRKSGHVFHTSAEMEVVQDIKEKVYASTPRPSFNFQKEYSFYYLLIDMHLCVFCVGFAWSLQLLCTIQY